MAAEKIGNLYARQFQPPKLPFSSLENFFAARCIFMWNKMLECSIRVPLSWKIKACFNKHFAVQLLAVKCTLWIRNILPIAINLIGYRIKMLLSYLCEFCDWNSWRLLACRWVAEPTADCRGLPWNFIQFIVPILFGIHFGSEISSSTIEGK